MTYPKVTGLEVRGFVVDAVPCDCPAEYATSVNVSIEGLTDPMQPEDFGKMHLLKLSLSRAAQDGVSVKSVCFGSAMQYFYTSLFDKQGQIREELHVDPNWCDLLLFEQMAIPAEYRTPAVVAQAIETVIAFLGPRCLVVVMTGEDFGMQLTDDELEALRVTWIRDTPFWFRRPNPSVALKSPNRKKANRVRSRS